jgi:putative nucleotidyltransferase with HDIG domain
MRELASPNASAESVADLIRKDMSLTAKILQLVNSAFFGVAHTVEDVRDAVQILGFSTVRTLSLSIYVFSRFDPATMPGFPMDRMWNHSMATGLLARRIAAREWGNLGIVEAAFTGGILHDIGKLVLAYSLPEMFQRSVDLAQERGMALWRAENEVIGGNHAEVGAYLLGLWGLPATIVESVAWHHHPHMREPQEFSPLTAVHMANFVQARKVPVFGDGLLEEVDQDYLRALKLGSTVSMWEQEP